MRVLKIVVVLLLGLAAGVSAGYVLRGARDAAAVREAPGRRVLYWVDPMHPAYTSDKPGTAPDCGMKLEPVYAEDEDPPGMGTPAPAAGTVLYYRDPKAPTYTATAAGVNPETGNTLEPVYADSGAVPARPPGTVRIPIERQQLAGVTFATVVATDVGRTLRTVGKVGYDETRVQHVHPRVDGWVEKVFVDFTGDLVKQGQPMLTLYSPEMLASQEELLLARRARDTMRNNPLASAAAQGESLFRAARQRLVQWNLSEAQIDEILETGQPIRNTTLHAPAAGFVLERNAFPNQRVTPETDLYTLADLSRVWVMADVYEADFDAVRQGAAARILLPYGDAKAAIPARINYVQPSVDPTTRTLKLRLEASNPGLRLRPEMFVDIEFPVLGGSRLVVPADAVLNSGERQVVFVDSGDGYLEPRDVELGPQVGSSIVVVSGVSEGERVVASGTFLVDAESQLKAALGSMSGHQHDSPPTGQPPTLPPSTPSRTTPPAKPPSPSTGGRPEGHRHD
jgi:RND family efflux transporter MFP subunit